MRLWRVRRPLGVRLRSAVAAAAVVAVTVLLAGVVLLIAVRTVLIGNVDATAGDKADQVAAVLKDGGDVTSLLRPTARDRTVVQVLDVSGAVRVASDELSGQAPMSSSRPVAGKSVREQRNLAVASDEPFRIVALGVSTSGGTETVLVGESLELVTDGTAAVVVSLLVGLPLLALIVGGATFLFVGRSLRPVEAMRRRAAGITSQSLHDRLPVPDTQDEVAALATTMNTMLDRIERASAAQRQFVADASHELRSPLATVQANVDLMANQITDDAPVRSLARVRTESARMARLIEDLLLLARIDDDGVRLRLRDVDLDDLAYAERERLAVEYPDVTVRCSVEPVRVTGDPDALQRVLRNLADNAIRYAVTHVTITVAAAGDDAVIAVGNDGPPIPPAERDRIFDRFVRLDDSRSRTGGGTGLGLPIARDIVLAHQGTLTVDDRDDGVTMRIRLPLPQESPPPGSGQPQTQLAGSAG